MDNFSKYWKICSISHAREQVGYKYRLVPTAKEFIQAEFFKFKNGKPQDTLLSYFHRTSTANNATLGAQAGLALRCYVSESILKACKRIDNLFGGEKHFTYQDLLPFVLNDDGKTLIILDKDGKNHLILDNKGKTQTTA